MEIAKEPLKCDNYSVATTVLHASRRKKHQKYSAKYLKKEAPLKIKFLFLNCAHEIFNTNLIKVEISQSA